MARIILTSLILIATTVGSWGVTFNVVYLDGPSEGFYDPTLGDQRRAAFEFALARWGALLEGTVPITVEAQFDPLGSNILAGAGPITVHRDFSGAPVPGIWYVAAQANQLAGSDLNGSDPEIGVTASSDFDFYLGTDFNPPAGGYDFVTIIMHEIGHGLGFLDLIDTDGTWFNGYPDAYGRMLTHSGVGNFMALTDAQRATALVSGDVFWIGPNAVGAVGQAEMYAPNPYEMGSSISHWDPNFSNSPNYLMEPAYTGPLDDIDITRNAFLDIGWTFQPQQNNAPVAGDDGIDVPIRRTVRIDVLNNDTDTDFDPLTVTSVTTSANGFASINVDGSVSYTHLQGDGVDSFTYTIDDGNGGTDVGTVTVTILYAQLYDDFESGRLPMWDHSASQGTDGWLIRSDLRHHTPSNARTHVPGASAITDSRLNLNVTLGGNAALVFWHTYAFEAGFDGGALEISTDGGSTWTDLGPSITSGGYTGTISTSYDSPIAGRNAWTGGQFDEMTRVTVDLSAHEGNAVISWRFTSDQSIASDGWQIDDVMVTTSAMLTSPLSINTTPPTILQHLLGLTPPTPEMDINGDGKVEIGDLVISTLDVP